MKFHKHLLLSYSILENVKKKKKANLIKNGGYKTGWGFLNITFQCGSHKFKDA